MSETESVERLGCPRVRVCLTVKDSDEDVLLPNISCF